VNIHVRPWDTSKRMLRPRSSISKLQPYSNLMADRDGLCLDLNENTGGCSPRVAARLRSLTPADLARYPDREAGERLLAKYLGVTPEQVLLTNGVDDALVMLAVTYLGEAEQMIFAEPTFVMYPMVGQAAGARLTRIPMGEDFSYPTEQLLKCISPPTRLIAIANPNNPTGLAVPRTDLLRIVEAAPDAAVLVDEAYFDFYGETLLAEVSQHSNLLVARTFSKAYGMAGLRVGALIGPPEQLEFLRRLCPPFNVNAVAFACLEEALADQEFVANHVAQIKQEQQRFQKLCAELGLRSWPSQTNFALVRLNAGCKPFVEAMRQRGIIIRDMSASPGCEGCARITIGTSGEMDRVAEAMRAAIKFISADLRG
jgi:histidinol-phosphate aminotransferase